MVLRDDGSRVAGTARRMKLGILPDQYAAKLDFMSEGPSGGYARDSSGLSGKTYDEM
jgi:hypothetical protein